VGIGEMVGIPLGGAAGESLADGEARGVGDAVTPADADGGT
jgi:hypothetical protein